MDSDFFPQAMEEAVERQRQMTRQRLEAKRRKRDEQQYEEDMAASIVTMAEKQFALIREKTMMKRAGHKETVSDIAAPFVLIQHTLAISSTEGKHQFFRESSSSLVISKLQSNLY